MKKVIYKIKNVLVATVGFLLSPLSWWNDLFVNVPLAYLFALVSGRVIVIFVDVNKPFFIGLFVTGYWITNFLGMLMLRIGAVNVIKYEEEHLPEFKKKLIVSYKWDLIIACVYSVVISWLIYIDYNGIISSLHILPSWIK